MDMVGALLLQLLPLYGHVRVFRFSWVTVCSLIHSYYKQNTNTNEADFLSSWTRITLGSPAWPRPQCAPQTPEWLGLQAYSTRPRPRMHLLTLQKTIKGSEGLQGWLLFQRA